MNKPASASAAGLLDRLGWRAERRPEPGFAHTLGAGAAFFAVAAVFAVILEVTSDDPTLPGVAFNLALAAVAYVMGMRLAGPTRSTAVTILVLTMPLVWGFALFGSGGGGTGDARAFYLLNIVTYAALYVIGWTRGHSILLGLALLVLVLWLVFEIGNHDSGPLPFQTTIDKQNSVDTPFGSSSNGEFSTKDRKTDDTTETSITALVVGLIYLGVGGVLDARKRAGLATPFIVVGGIATVVGAAVLGFNESLLAGGLLAAVSGAAVGMIGGLGTDRRASTWIGVIVAVSGLLIVLIDSVGSFLGFAGLAAVVALGLGFIALLTVHRLGEFTDGDTSTPT
jgi:hypothetical protein